MQVMWCIGTFPVSSGPYLGEMDDVCANCMLRMGGDYSRGT